MNKFILVSTFAALLTACQSTSGIIPNGSGLDLCNDYLATTTCTGGSYSFVRPNGEVVRVHQGLDFVAPEGTEVIAASDGQIMDTGHSTCGGGFVSIFTNIRTHNPKFPNNPDHLFALYLHLDPDKFPVRVGERVKAGQIIGYLGSSENDDCSSEPHLHFELRAGGSQKEHRSPHGHWLSGPRKVTCYRDGMDVPPDKLVAPLRCR